MGVIAADMTGKRFGRLTVIDYAGSRLRHGGPLWSCQCDCGNETVVYGKNLRRGYTASCGCGKYKHRMARTREHNSWVSMIQRCTNPKYVGWKYYGGRGITVCDRWRDFVNFYADMGERPPGMTIDRIDPDGNYEPGNCRWATATVQSNNQRRANQHV